MENTRTEHRVCDEPFEREPRLCAVCRLSPQVDGLKRCSQLVAESPAMREVLVRAAPVAKTGASVVLLGESGAGKEVLARALHVNSPRRRKPFVAVNVAALPSELLESELFGHVRGAFTGAATSKRGLMEAADGGTLFLDEIGEMPRALQAKLLRALQDGEVRRVGDTRPFSVDVRIVCATNRDLLAEIDAGRFRRDLYYRLAVFTLTVPPLRARREDVLPLVRTFLAHEGRPGATLTPAAERALLAHPWPGNVRELMNAVTHAVALSMGGEIDAAHLPEALLRPVVGAPEPGGAAPRLRPLAEVEREHVLAVLEACGGSQTEAARILGIGRNTLWRKLKAWDVR